MALSKDSSNDYNNENRNSNENSNAPYRFINLGKLLVLPLLIMLLCVVISHYLIQQTQQQNKARTEQKMSQRLQEISTDITEKITLYQYGLRGLRSTILATGVNNLTYQTIVDYSASRDIETEFPGARGFGVIRYVAPENLTAFIQSAKLERKQDFTIKNLDAAEDTFFIIQYIEPEADNYSAIGLNIGSEKMRRKAALNAAKQDNIQLTAPITLVQDQQKDKQGLLLLMPIYQQAQTPNSEQQRLQQLYGWSYAPIFIGDVLKTVSSVSDDISLSINDITDITAIKLFNFGNTATETAAKPVTASLNLHGRVWQLTMSAQPAFINGLQLLNTEQLLRQYLVISGLLTILIFFVQILLIRRTQLAEKHAQLIAVKAEALEVTNAKLERQVQQRTAEIAQVSTLQRSILNGTSYAVIATDIDGLITLINPAAEQMLGYSAAEVVHKHSPAMFHIADEVQQHADLLSAELATPIAPDFSVFVAKAKLGLQDETKWTYVRKDGSHCPVKLRVNALTNDQKQFVGFLGIAEDLTEREQLEFELELSRVSIQKAADPMFWLDVDGNIIKANPAAHRNFGQQNLLQRNMLTVEQDSSIEQWQQLREQLHQQADMRFNSNYKTETGDIKPVSVTATLLTYAKHEYIYLVARDISAQQQRERELATARDNADNANNAKSAFLANMSHEIRTPMNAILGLLQLVQQTHLDKRQRDYIEKTQVASQSLLEILNDILDFSKVEAGKLELELQPFSLSSLMHDLAVILAASAADKNLEILYDLDSDIPDILIGDALRIKQILINLAGNAIKFTEQGEVILAVRAQLSSDNTIQLIFKIQDTGIGMTPEQISQIFSGFQQAESSISRRFGGTGLGLAISKRLIELMQGHISVTSTPNVGSKFTVTMMLNVAKQQSEATEVNLPEQLRLLIVDDNQQARVIMTDIVQSFAWQCDAVATGTAALQAITAAVKQQQKYDIVLLDWHMPDQNGLQVAEAIQNSINDADKPLIIMVSAYSKDVFSYRSTDYKQLIDGFIMKPMTRMLLAKTLTDIFSTTPEKELLLQQIQTEQSQPLVGIKLLLVEDNATNQLVASELLSQQGASIEVASSGKQALAILTEQAETFSAVLMDIQMPGMDGYQTTQHIRQQLKLTNLPIIAMTANAMASDVKACLDAGMQDHVAKPFDLNELIRKILQHSKEISPASNTAVVNATAEQSDLPIVVQQFAAEKHIALNQAMQQLGNSTAFYIKVLRQFKQDVGQYRLQLTNTQLSPSEQLLIFHSLKSTAAMLGFKQLANSAADFELQLNTTDHGISQQQVGTILNQIDAAQQHSAELLRLLAPSLTDQSVGFNTNALHDNIQLLQSQLDSANMAAVNLFEQLKPSLQPLDPQLVTQLAQAMTTLSFVSAGQLLVQLKQILDRQVND
ncbi:CHASE domain-containing protein [Rheinheimera salexigens]|uniref:Sensory/regulatory protein RpfC n=1 Tax=Rheinheimera salexigens TaxID=1628148 RepID=A0A1E7Q470_9GAMM|nr:CHASE domain-containing protein [Rheinheimera salexigens]OEY68873.1 hypothetical protein BI198_04300 [Rheinheimera salexigens]